MDTIFIWVLAYFLLASQFYIFDKKGKFGLRRMFLFFYNLGHRQEITYEQVNSGFVYNQPVATRLTVAVIFDLCLSIVCWKLDVAGTGMKIILLFLGTPAVFLGFWFGGMLLEAANRIFKKTVKTIDDIETGKIDPVEKLHQSYTEVKKEFKGSGSKEKKKRDAPVEAAEEHVKTEQQEKDEALAALRAFQRGSRNGK